MHDIQSEDFNIKWQVTKQYSNYITVMRYSLKGLHVVANYIVLLPHEQRM